MVRRQAPLFDVSYDWDSGTWLAIVRDGAGGIAARRTGYELETDAIESLSNLRKMLAAAPNGDTEAVLRIWESEPG